MYVIKNALRNIRRNRGRNILIGSIILVIIVSTVVSLMINNTSAGIIEDYKTRFGAEIKITPNMQKMKEEAEQTGQTSLFRPAILPEHLIAFGDSEYLKETLYSSWVSVNSDDVVPIGDTSSTKFQLKLMGNMFSDFEDGLRTIAEGRMPQADNECVISTDLAQKSGLSIGDTINASSELINPETNESADISYFLSIVGIYDDATDEYASGTPQIARNNRRNEILTTFGTVVEPIVSGMRGIEVEATYIIKSPDVLDAFAEEVYSKGLSDLYDVSTDEAGYERIVAPVEGLKGISIAFVIIVVVFGGVIVSLLCSIAIRERKYEIGVLRAMGMKKRKVALGLWSELLVITGLCLILGLLVGTIVAQPVTNIMLDSQIAAAEEAESKSTTPGFQASGGQTSREDTGAQLLTNMNVSLDLITLLEIIGIALLLSSMAALISISKITKYEPIKILMERN